MERNWTPAQAAAIDARGRDLLISAGAGSGKTAVLTERMIRRLCDENDPGDISRMLVVTFTKAAAGELKERISSKLEEALAKQPGNRRLARQLLTLERAKISTIHSFCLDALKASDKDTGLPADFRIADSVEINLLRAGIMNELIEDYFSVGVTEFPIEDFPSFADIFVGTKGDDALADTFLSIENKLSSFTEHIDFIKNFADELAGDDRDFALTPCGREILTHAGQLILSYKRRLEAVLPEILENEKLTKAYYPSFSADIEFIDRAVDVCRGDSYDAARRVFTDYAPLSLKSYPKDQISSELEAAKSLRTELNNARKDIVSKYFSLTSEGLTKNRKDTAEALRKLYTILDAFISRFSAEKKKRGIVDFCDLERITYRLLVDNGKPTEFARTLSAQYDEIFIDEYQDVNAIQDAIFTAIGNGKNRFMVGDIKQSIYAFRGSEPTIFADYRRRFGTLEDNDTENGAAIFLSNNFRCDDTVIRFSNIVSGCLFTSGRGDIPFSDGDLLIHSKPDTETGEPVHVALIDSEAGDEEGDVSSMEAEYIAREIKKLLREGKKNNGTPIRPSDITVLLRSSASSSPAIEAAFDRHGIPYYNDLGGSFFENAEVLLMLCILNIIDNPTRDIYLAGALQSPVFGVTLDELIKIRRQYPEGSLFNALRLYCDAEDLPKGREFLVTLERWRRKAEGLPVDKLLWYIYTDTDMNALVFDRENSVRRQNLMLLYEYARRFEGSSFKGLYNFIGYINDILEGNEQLETAKLFGEDSDTVKLMNIHKSKGLEFPVCFISATGKRFNDTDLRKNVVMDKHLGISLKLSDETGFARYDTPIRQAIVKRLGDSQLEEEMRILYVAMTRARERLYVTGMVKKPDELLSAVHEDAENLSPYVIMKNNGYMRWILTALEHHKLTCDDTPPVTVEVIRELAEDDTPEAVAKAESTPVFEAYDAEALRALIHERFDFTYKSNYASKLPAKLSVSKLTPNILDEDAAELEGEDATFDFAGVRPLFMETEAEVKATGAERGTATHLFMQFCDFSRFIGRVDDIAEAIEDEAARLAERRYITKRAASLINVRAVAKFFSGELFSHICASCKLHREHRFNVKLPASDFTEDIEAKEALSGETVLVQGVIDCFFENPDGTITLIDYKTDFVPSELTFEEACEMLIERHRLQLMYYKAACEKISAKKVSRVAIYSFALGCTVEIPII